MIKLGFMRIKTISPQSARRTQRKEGFYGMVQVAAHEKMIQLRVSPKIRVRNKIRTGVP